MPTAGVSDLGALAERGIAVVEDLAGEAKRLAELSLPALQALELGEDGQGALTVERRRVARRQHHDRAP